MHILLESMSRKVRKEGRKCLFNNTLNTFYLRLYGVRHMVTDHSDSERGNPLPPHGLLFPISSNNMKLMEIVLIIGHNLHRWI